MLEIGNSGLATWLALFALQAFSILVHELGHAAAAKSIGSRILAIAVLGVQFDCARRRFGSATAFSGNDVGGYVIHALPEHLHTRRNDAIIAAAGPLANVLLAGLAFLLVPAAPMLRADYGAPPAELLTVSVEAGRPNDSSPVARLPSEAQVLATMREFRAKERRNALAEATEKLLQLLVAMSLGLGLLNLLPSPGSDGEVIWRALNRRS